LIICSSLALSKKKKAKQVKHVSELSAATPSGKDQSPLWKNFDKQSYNKVKYGGVKGNLWTPPTGNPESDGGFSHIASPHPGAKPKTGDRIIANELPGKTMSASSFDLPKRGDVLQINLPQSTTKTTNYSYNAYTTPVTQVNNLRQKASLHGIDSVVPRVLHGRFQEMEEEGLKIDQNEIKTASADALSQAKKVEKSAAALAAGLTPEPTNLVLPVTMKNKKDVKKQ